MKQSFLSFTFLSLFCFSGFSQPFSTDSLLGFDEANKAVHAHQLNLKDAEVKIYVNQAKRAFIKKKYNLVQLQNQQTQISKYSSNTIVNYPCLNEGFDGISTGLISTGGWIADQTSQQSYVCTTSLIPMYTNSTAVYVYYMPVTDGVVGTLNNSPFGTGKIAKINNTGLDVARIRQTFSVTSTNLFYNYAYKGVLSGPTHGCCGDPFLMFRFYDCSGNFISSLSQTVVLGTPSCVSTSTTNWVASTASIGLSYTPNWEVFSLNLGAYLGSCITVEVIASSCIYGSEYGYMYYDADCSEDAIRVNGDYVLYDYSMPSYTSCVNPATVSVLPGVTSYTWQGPGGSSISNLTNSTFTTSTSGIYTLTTLNGTLVSTHTYSLGITPTLAISGPTAICAGQGGSLQVTGGSSNTYSWSTGSIQQSILVFPSSTSLYSVEVVDALGCTAVLSKTLNVLPLALLNITSASTSVCLGQSLVLSAISPGINTFTWTPGNVSPTIAISPTVTTIYTISAIAVNGCLSSATQTIAVYSLPQVQIVSSSPSLCLGQQTILTATGTVGNSYNWSGGGTNYSIAASPSLTSTYNVTVTSVFGCTAATSTSVSVYPLPQFQFISTATTICVGQSANFGITGSNISTILWNTGATSLSITVSPTINSIYTSTVSSMFGCKSTGSVVLKVDPLPQGQIIATSDSICAGESATLSINGSSLVSYQWMGSQTTQSIVVSPSVSTSYSIVFTDIHNCSSSTSLQLKVSLCTSTLTGITSLSGQKKGLIIFPNPSEGSFEIKGFESGNIILLNDIGQIIAELYLLQENKYSTRISNLSKGVYLVRSKYGVEKLVVR